MSATVWQCPYCPHKVDDPDEGVRRVAVNVHLKSHGRLPDGPRVGSGGGRGRSSSRGDGWVDAVADVVGDAVGGAIGALARIFD